jgi:hypothetical protein
MTDGEIVIVRSSVGVGGINRRRAELGGHHDSADHGDAKCSSGHGLPFLRAPPYETLVS